MFISAHCSRLASLRAGVSARAAEAINLMLLPVESYADKTWKLLALHSIKRQHVLLSLHVSSYDCWHWLCS